MEFPQGEYRQEQGLQGVIMDTSQLPMGSGKPSKVLNGIELAVRLRWCLYRRQSLLLPSYSEHSGP